MYEHLPIYFRVWELDAHIVWVVPIVIGMLYTRLVALPTASWRTQAAWMGAYLAVGAVCLAQGLYTRDMLTSQDIAMWSMLVITLWQAHRHVSTPRHYATLIAAAIGVMGAIQALTFARSLTWSEYHVRALAFAAEAALAILIPVLAASAGGSAVLLFWRRAMRRAT